MKVDTGDASTPGEGTARCLPNNILHMHVREKGQQRTCRVHMVANQQPRLHALLDIVHGSHTSRVLSSQKAIREDCAWLPQRTSSIIRSSPSHTCRRLSAPLRSCAAYRPSWMSWPFEGGRQQSQLNGAPRSAAPSAPSLQFAACN